MQKTADANKPRVTSECGRGRRAVRVRGSGGLATERAPWSTAGPAVSVARAGGVAEHMMLSEWTGPALPRRPGAPVWAAIDPRAGYVPCVVVRAAAATSLGWRRETTPVYLVQPVPPSPLPQTWAAADALTSPLAVAAACASLPTGPLATDGAVDVETAGGTPPYTYQVALAGLGPGEFVPLRQQAGADRVRFTGLAGGLYRFAVIDSAGVYGHTCVALQPADRACAVLPPPPLPSADAWPEGGCIACGKPRTAAFRPCGHVAMCWECAGRTCSAARCVGAPLGTCPCCRAILTEVDFVWIV